MTYIVQALIILPIDEREGKPYNTEPFRRLRDTWARLLHASPPLPAEGPQARAKLITELVLAGVDMRQVDCREVREIEAECLAALDESKVFSTLAYPPMRVAFEFDPSDPTTPQCQMLAWFSAGCDRQLARDIARWFVNMLLQKLEFGYELIELCVSPTELVSMHRTCCSSRHSTGYIFQEADGWKKREPAGKDVYETT